MESVTWEALSKSEAKFNIQVLLKNSTMPFLLLNTFEIAPPFLIFYNKTDTNKAKLKLESGDINIVEYHEQALIPLPNELLTFYEDFDNRKYPKQPLRFLRREYYIVTFTDQYIHGLDGNGYGVLIYMIGSQFAIKLYSPEEVSTNIIFFMQILCDELSK